MEIVCLQDGSSGVSAYCLPMSTGSIDAYFELAKALGPGHLIFGIQLADRLPSGEFKTFSSLKEMAAAISTELLLHHVNGPICLIGYSFAAFLTIEVARQLIEQGKPIPLVIIIDTIVPWASFTLLFRVKHFAGNVFPLAVRIASRLVANSKYRMSYWHALLHGLRKKGVARQDWFQELPDNYQNYVKKNAANLGSYHFEGFFRGKILLLRQGHSGSVDDHPFNFSRLKDYGWRGFTGATVDVVYTPGDHASMMQFPNVLHVANSLRSALDEFARSVRIAKDSCE